MEKLHAIITGVGGYVPDYVLTNDELSRMVDTSDEWIMSRIGVHERRILNEEGLGASYMARKAVKQLLEKTGCDPLSVDAVICSTSTPDYHFPSTASLVIGKCGLTDAFGFDMEAACAGFLYAMEAGAGYIRSGRYKRIIICGGDHMSSMTNYEDRNTCPIFGDGAACVMMEATTEEGVGLIDGYYRVDGKGFQNLHMAAGGSARMPSHETVDAREHYVYQEGRQVFKHAVIRMSDAVETIARRNGLTKDDITWIVPHQANVRIEAAVAKRVGVDESHVMINIDHMANTSGGTLPLCLWEYEPQLKKGDKLILTAFGAGFTWGASYMVWGYDGAAEAAKEPAQFYKEGMISREDWYRLREVHSS